MPKDSSVYSHSILFICTANQCRSPMAEVLFKDLVSRKDRGEDWNIESAGCWARPGIPATDAAILVMVNRGLDLSEHASQPVTEALLEQFDLILCMETEHKQFIQRNFPSVRENTFLLSGMVGEKREIWDPVGMSLIDYEETANEILDILEKGFAKIIRHLSISN
ncbi:MAG TPA: low molecular weight protein arginine phosphatase [Pelolinea sp.]|nr:low molecular weight protein arginine phosphatase [Pelolinea sp.]